MANQLEQLPEKVKALPNAPGIYKYYDASGKLIYVGKAKNLKKRVSQYFTKKRYENAKTKVLVSKIVDLQFTVVESEHDALLLENNLIKEFKPRYNVQLKDDKTFPWICVKKEPFPRIFSTRNPVKDGSKYYGPYASVKIMRTLMDLVRQIYPLRTCNLPLTQENIEAGKFKVCLEYHIGNCKGPCIDYSLKEAYDQDIDDIKNIIRGKTNRVIRGLKDLMKKAAEDLDFEKAQLIKDKLDLLENYQAKSTVVSASVTNVDVFSVVSDVNHAYVNYLHVIDGAIVNSHTLQFKKKLEETDIELLGMGVAEMRRRFESDAKEVVLPYETDFIDENLKITIPQRGDKKQLLDLSSRNARFYMLDWHKREASVDPERNTNRILDTIQKDFRLTELPVHIECFDNSNFQGTNAVAACVVFKNAKPSKKEYRHFNIKTVEGPDDFASMEEVVYRRYKRLLDEDQPLPQLIVIDGGKGQLGAACKSLRKLDLIGKVAIVGIAKRLEEIFFPGDSYPIYIDKRSESLKVIQHLRNEAHRFGITHHRNKRSKNALGSELDSIPGIGEQTVKMLLSEFRSAKRVSEASMDDLVKVVGKSKAQKVFDHFKSQP